MYEGQSISSRNFVITFVLFYLAIYYFLDFYKWELSSHTLKFSILVIQFLIVFIFKMAANLNTCSPTEQRAVIRFLTA